MKNKLLQQIIMLSKLAIYGIFLQCLFLGMLMAADSEAQSVRSVREVKIKLGAGVYQVKEIFDNIEALTNFYFSYYPSDIDIGQKVTISGKNLKVSDVLLQVCKETDLAFRQINNNINVRIRKKNVPVQSIEVVIEGITITGKVTSSEDGSGLPGVNVVIKGTTMGTVTDINGNYKLDVSDVNSILVFSSVGYVTEERKVGNNTAINVIMSPDVTSLQEVVVTGYGTVKKSDLTGSIAQVQAEDIAAYPSVNMIQSLQGRAAGVLIEQNNGEPGATFKVRIRGGTSINASSDPLYVVDGMPNGILPSPEDIQSIEVLKDASSTAIYGSRAANGVIMVTTKKGARGRSHISLNTSYSTQKEINRLPLLNKDQFLDLYEELYGHSWPGVIGPGTDWQEEIFQTGQIQNYQLSFSGGNENVNYYISGIYYDQKGVVVNSRFKRFSVASNVNIKASKRLNIGVNLLAQRYDKDGVRTQEGSGGLYRGVVAAAFTAEPTLPVYDEDGNYSISTINDPVDNAVAIANERKNQSITDMIQINSFGDYMIIKDLKFRINLGASISNGREGLYYPTTLMAGANTGGMGNIDGSKYTLLINEDYFTYSKKFGVNDLTVMAGYSYQSTSSEWWRAAGQSFLTDAGYWWGLNGAAVFSQPGSNLTETALTSFYGRINYKLFDRYLITVNGRYDGSSRFAKNNKWAFFPSGAIAWNIADEPFMQDAQRISQLKLRASYGVTGSQSIAAYQSLARFSPVHSIQNSQIVNAVRPTTVANDNLTWESTAQLDVGFEFGMFKQRIVLVADYYNKITDNLLFNMPLPQYTGFPSMLKNIGKVQNKGIELTLSGVIFDGEFNWVCDANFTRNRNQVLELPEGNDIRRLVMPGHMVGISATSILREGYPVGSFYGYVYDGIYQEDETILPGNFDQFPGGEKLKDINGRDSEGNLTGEPDGKIDADDRTIIGNPHPDFIWGFNNSFSYKGFDLNIFFLGSQGNDLYSFTLMELETMRGISNTTTKALERWTPTNTNTDVPAANINRGYHSSSRWIFDGSFVRLKNIALGYTLPDKISNSIGIELLRIYISGQNVLTFTRYRGYDPEVNWNTRGPSRGNLNVGLDYGSYPNAKSFTVGLNMTF